MALIDPDAARMMELASQVLTCQDVIARQRVIIWALVTALRASQRAQLELTELLDQVLASDG